MVLRISDSEFLVQTLHIINIRRAVWELDDVIELFNKLKTTPVVLFSLRLTREVCFEYANFNSAEIASHDTQSSDLVCSQKEPGK